MAKTITIEFTDAQWELVKEHYPPQYWVDPQHMVEFKEWTAELLATWLKQEVQAQVNTQIAFQATQVNPFGDV